MISPHNALFSFLHSRNRIFSVVLLLAISLSTIGAGSYQPETIDYPIPSNLTATVGQPTRITLEWDSAAQPLLGYFEIHPSLNGAGMRIIEVPYIGGGHYSYTIIVDDTQFQAYYDYSFRVRACPANRTACSDASNEAIGSAIISPPYVFASDGTYTDRVEITFPEYVEDADRIYEVYRADNAAGPYTLLGDFRTGYWGSDPNVFIDSTVVPGTTYFYKGVICNSDFSWQPGHCSAMSTNPAQGYASVTAPGINATDGTSAEIVVTWDSNPSAIYYELYRTTANTPPDTSDPANIYRDGLTSTTYADEGMTPYRQYYYWVRAYIGTGMYSDLSSSDSGWRLYENSHNLRATVGVRVHPIELTWDNYDSALLDLYFIYRADTATGTPALIGSTSLMEYSDASSVWDTGYYYWVQACSLPSMTDPVMRCGNLAGPEYGKRGSGLSPIVNGPADRTIDEDTVLTGVNVYVEDGDTPLDLVTVTVTSSNTTLVPNANIALGATGGTRALTITPAANQHGSTTITFTADDGTYTGTDSFVLTVASVNDAPTDLSLSSDSVPENQPSGTVVGTFTTTDLDGDHGYVSLVPGIGDSGNSMFTTGSDDLLTAAVFDYETQNSYSIRVRTDDQHGGTYEEVFTITITDANDDPHDISLSSTSVAENQPVGTAVGTISGQDQDGNSLTFALVPGSGDTGNASFSVDGTTLRTQAVFDYETQSSYSIRLQADDGNAGTYEEIFTINITDADEIPPQVDSIVRADPNPTAASSVEFTVTFSESVTGVDVTDFGLSYTNINGPSVTGVSGSGDTYTVTVDTGTGSGTVKLDLIDNDSIVDLVGNPLAGPYTNGSFLSGEEYTLDRVAPVVVSITRVDANPNSSSSVEFEVEFSKPVNGVDDSDFTPTFTGISSAAVWSYSGSGSTTYILTVDAGPGSGTLRLDVSDDDSIQDALGNPLGGPGAVNGDYVDGESYYIDRDPPTVVLAADAVPGGTSVLTIRPSTLEIQFDEPLLDDMSLQAVNNAANYLLLQPGLNGVYDTSDCADTTPVDDILIPVGPVLYDSGGGWGPFVATLTVNAGTALPLGDYRLHICGTTSIEDLAGNELNGGASDAVVEFSVVEPNLPATGFAPFEETMIPAQPAERAYASMDGMWLEIPALGVMQPIMGVPALENAWDLTWLGARVGYLDGTAFPTWSGNTALTAHVTTPDGAPGTFAELSNLAWDDEVIIHAGGERYVYAVRSNTWYADPSDIGHITQHEEVDWVTLITCRGYDAASGMYRWRTIVRAVRVDVQPETLGLP